MHWMALELLQLEKFDVMLGKWNFVNLIINCTCVIKSITYYDLHSDTI
jgi:hypothetical protein